MTLRSWLVRLNGEAGEDLVPEPELIEPTEDERKNGWTAETLTAYLAERRQAEADTALRMFDKRRHRPRWANSKYSPFRWRRARA